MRAGLALVLLVGCGGPSKPAPSGPQPPPPNPGAGSGAVVATPAGPTTAAVATDPQTVCNRILQLKKEACWKFVDVPFADLGQCVDEFKKEADDPMVKTFAGCVVQPSCEEVKNCMLAASQQQPGGDPNGVEGGEEGGEEGGVVGGDPGRLRDCKDSASMDPVGIPADAFAKRNGATAKKFSDVKSTKALPVEMCGIPAENQWLTSLKCDDGSQPIKNNLDAENVRAGNVGSGGRCGSIVDLYKPKCGGKTYDIYIDAYVCPKP